MKVKYILWVSFIFALIGTISCKSHLPVRSESKEDECGLELFYTQDARYEALVPLMKNRDNWDANQIIDYANKLKNNGFQNSKEVFSVPAP